MINNIKKYGLSFNKSIERWDEAIPLGNGKLGCLVYGDGPIKFAIDRIDLWDNRESQAVKNKDFTYRKFVECALNGEQGWSEKKRIFDANKDFPYPTKLSAGKFEIDFNEKSSNIKSSLDITKAVSTVTSEKFSLETFVCATAPLGIIRGIGDCNINLKIPDYFSGDENGEWSAPSGLVDNDGTIEIIENGCLKYPKSFVQIDNQFIYYKQNTLTEYSFGVVLLIKKINENFEIYYTVCTTDDDVNFINYAKKLLKNASDKGYDKLFLEHKKWWRKYWSKSSIDIPDKDIEKHYYLSWYLFASTSRKGGYPMPLQGVWTADSNAIPPWNGDYHHDTNTQMSYWGYLKANRLDEGSVFADYLWSLRNTYRNYTKKIYGVNGLLLPGCSTLDGKFMGYCVHYAFSPTMTIWAAKAFDDYYRYTGDIRYLKNRAFPFFREVAEAVTALLVNRNGKLYLPLSSSPEVFESTQKTLLIGNTNFDQSLLIYLYRTLLEYCKILNLDCSKYQNVLDRLDEIYISEDNVIKLSEQMKLPYSHRHFSHLMCIYPLGIIKYDTEKNKKIINASMQEIEQLGCGWWVGFSFAWSATLYAIQRNGNAAREKLSEFVNGFLSPNGFHLNGDYKRMGFSQWHYRPFTLEALFGFCDGLQEMLLQENNGHVHLFPAIPEKWTKKVSFNKLRIHGGVLISSTMKNGNIVSLKFYATKNQKIKLLNSFAPNGFKVVNKNSIKEYDCLCEDVCEIELYKGTNEIIINS